MPFSPVEEILEEIKQGKMVIVCDDEDRENEGDLTMAAELVTPEDINFMALYGRGLICLPMAGEIIDRLEIPETDKHNHPRMGTAFMASIEAATGITNGISATDRARTIQVAADPESGPKNLITPGHVFPLRAHHGGVLRRPGQTEAAVDLARLAGLNPAGVICEVMKDDGTMARVPDLEEFSKRHKVKMVSVTQIAEYRRRYDEYVRCIEESWLATSFGEFRLKAYESETDSLTHLALLMGHPEGRDNVLVQIHCTCLLGEVFRSMQCNCRSRLEIAMRHVQREGEGVIIYVQHEQEGTGLLDEIKAHHLQGRRPDTVEAKGHRIGVQILKDLGLKHVRFMSSEPTKLVGIQGPELEIAEGELR